MAIGILSITIGLFVTFPGIGVALILHRARLGPIPAWIIATTVGVLCIWVLSEATNTYLFHDFDNIVVSILAYIAVCLLGAQTRHRKGFFARLLHFAIVTAIIFGPAIIFTRSTSQSTDEYAPHHIERLAGNLTCYVNYWGEPMFKQGQRVILRQTLGPIPILQRKVSTVIVESSGFSEGFFTCQDALALYRAGETYKYIVH